MDITEQHELSPEEMRAAGRVSIEPAQDRSEDTTVPYTTPPEEWHEALSERPTGGGAYIDKGSSDSTDEKFIDNNILEQMTQSTSPDSVKQRKTTRPLHPVTHMTVVTGKDSPVTEAQPEPEDLPEDPLESADTGVYRKDAQPRDMDAPDTKIAGNPPMMGASGLIDAKAKDLESRTEGTDDDAGSDFAEAVNPEGAKPVDGKPVKARVAGTYEESVQFDPGMLGGDKDPDYRSAAAQSAPKSSTKDSVTQQFFEEKSGESNLGSRPITPSEQDVEPVDKGEDDVEDIFTQYANGNQPAPAAAPAAVTQMAHAEPVENIKVKGIFADVDAERELVPEDEREGTPTPSCVGEVQKLREEADASIGFDPQAAAARKRKVGSTIAVTGASLTAAAIVLGLALTSSQTTEDANFVGQDSRPVSAAIAASPNDAGTGQPKGKTAAAMGYMPDLGAVVSAAPDKGAIASAEPD
jgi:hypothetical protein